MRATSERHHSSQRRRVWPPEPGCFRMRLVAHGWMVPCRILHSDAGWQAEIDGEARPTDLDPALAEDVARIWHSGFIVTEDVYAWASHVREWAREHDPAHPSLHPQRPINPALLTPIIPRRQP